MAVVFYLCIFAVFAAGFVEDYII